jgi:transposase InsO family protein
MDERRRFVEDHGRELYDMTELSARYGISRKTGYKWLTRFQAEGRPGLADRSHAPHHCPQRIERAVARLIVSARHTHPSWGPRKLLDWLEPRHPDVEFPAASTVGDLLARRGLVKKRRRRRKHVHPGVVPAVTHEPNDLWTADFKGHFKTRDGIYCYPLTVADQHTRYLLACQGLLSIHGWRVRPVFERLFKEFGLPRAIRTDNGAPFANTGLHGLTQLNVWWIRLGITHQRIRPAHPQENGCHERMHRTLKYEATRPPKQNRAAQQRRFATFRVEYNTERPHEALGGKPPSSCYCRSPRPYPERLPALEYPGHFLVKPVTAAGTFRFKKKLLFIANALKHHAIGLEEVADGVWSIYLGNVLLGRLDERTYIIHG